MREKGPCPTLILAGGGPNYALCGAVWADRFIVQPLSDIVFLAEASTSPDEVIYKAARFFSAIRLGVDDLRDYYTKLITRTVEPLQNNPHHPRFHPYPTEFFCRHTQQSVSFRIWKGVDDDSRNLTYVANTNDPHPRKLIVKFVDRYGYKAHEVLEKLHLAPKLYYCGLLDGQRESDVSCCEKARGRTDKEGGGLYHGPMRMIVMQYLEGKDALNAKKECWPSNAYDQVASAIRALHDKDMVFGDLRPPNVIFVGADAKLIDFDWSGKEGEVFYPRGLSERVGWVDGVKSFRRIEKAHDKMMLEKHFR